MRDGGDVAAGTGGLGATGRRLVGDSLLPPPTVPAQGQGTNVLPPGAMHSGEVLRGGLSPAQTSWDG